MKSLLPSWPAAAAWIALQAIPTRPCFAQHWQDLGKVPDSLDSVSINIDSVEQDDQFRIVLIKTVYPEPRTNKSNITTDSHIQQTAIDCEKRAFYGIRMFGYLSGKQVGTGPVTPDWKAKLIPMGTAPLSQRILSTACSLPITSGTKTTAEPAPAPQPRSESAGHYPNAEQLLFAQPKDFKVGYNSPTTSMTEFVPIGQTVADWTEMITVQIFHNLKGAEPARFLQAIGKGYAAGCPGFSSPKGIGTGHSNGYVVSMLVVNCHNNPHTGKPETTLFRIISGKDALYSVQHAWRSVASDKDISDAAHALSKVTVCDTRGSNHPCPSLDSLAAPPKPQP